MAFPNVKPASREFSPGDWPIKRFNSQSGSEIRILYGSRRVNAKLTLGYENIVDTVADDFLADYTAQYGTLRTFTLPANVRAGWTGTASAIDAPPGTRWRYESEPRVTSVYRGLSSVQVTLVAVA
jgi:hypothetical protein